MSISEEQRGLDLQGRWRRNFLKVEFWIAVGLGCAAFGSGYFLGVNELISRLLEDGRGDIYSTLASIFGSLFGFIITATSIVLGFSGSDRLAVLRESPYYQDLWDTFLSTIKWLGAATAVALIAVIFDRGQEPVFFLIHAVFFATIIVVLRLVRSVWILEKVIKALTGPSKARSGGRQ